MKLARFIFLFLILFCSKLLYSLPAEDIEIINDRDYFPGVHELLGNAKKSIYLIMFSVYYYDYYPDSPSNILLRDLVNAKRRGVDVKIILEQGEPTSGGLFHEKKIQPQQLERVIRFLKDNNIPYILDPPDVTTHAKVIVIDELYTAIGSTNWSYSALSKNNETSVVIKSKEVAMDYIKYFNLNIDLDRK